MSLRISEARSKTRVNSKICLKKGPRVRRQNHKRNQSRRDRSMSHSHLTVPKPEIFESRKINRVLSALLGIGAFSLLVTLIIGLAAPGGSDLRRQFAFSWLFAVLYFFTILIGCFFWIIVHHATDSGWGIVVRRQMENLSILLPWMILFFLPLFLLRTEIWNWISAKNQVPMDPLLKAKLDFFEFRIGAIKIPFFWIRAIIYFVFFGSAALYFRHVSVRQDSDGDPRWSIKMRGFSFVCLV